MLSIFSLMGGTLIERARRGTVAWIEAETAFIAGHHSVSIDYANSPDGDFRILFHLICRLIGDQPVVRIVLIFADVLLCVLWRHCSNAHPFLCPAGNNLSCHRQWSAARHTVPRAFVWDGFVSRWVSCCPAWRDRRPYSFPGTCRSTWKGTAGRILLDS